MKTEDAFDQIAREYAAMIKRIACSYEADPSVAEDLVQEIYLATWRALPSFRGASSLRTFVARIATNRAVTHVARAVRSPSVVELAANFPTTHGDPEKRTMHRSERARLVSAVRSLPLAYRQAATLTLEGLTPKEIADTLGISANAVAIRMSRARELLRQNMGEDS